MLKWLIRNRLKAFEKQYGYDTGYMREMLDADASAVFAIGKLQALSKYKKDVPRDVYFAAAVTGTVQEDCGPCTQLMVSMALEQGVPPRQLAAILRADEAVMTEDVKLGAKFARAALAHAPEADELRDTIIAKWGKRAAISLAFAVTLARFYPTLKYALGHGKTCQRVVIDGVNIAVARSAA